ALVSPQTKTLHVLASLTKVSGALAGKRNGCFGQAKPDRDLALNPNPYLAATSARDQLRRSCGCRRTKPPATSNLST
uniref:Uncharacterized protein n=1 Tax=Oryza brachyantha TaxID=4533 RepID=J3NET7_ORYBR